MAQKSTAQGAKEPVKPPRRDSLATNSTFKRGTLKLCIMHLHFSSFYVTPLFHRQDGNSTLKAEVNYYLTRKGSAWVIVFDGKFKLSTRQIHKQSHTKIERVPHDSQNQYIRIRRSL